MSLCLVYAEADRMLTMNPPPTPTTTYYHRLDLVHTNETCNFFSKLRLTEASTVQFSGAAFVTPYQHYYVAESIDRVRRYEAYMAGHGTHTGVEGHFKAGVRGVVSLTASMDEFWRLHPNYVISSYLATFRGLTRVYPGLILDTLYAPHDRPWFKRAVANRGRFTFAAPYMDAFGFGIITTVSQTVFGGRSSGLHADTDPLAAVVAVDMRLGYLGVLLSQTFPACRNLTYRCFLVDTSGYLIYDQDFDQDIDQSDNLHIMEKDPDIAMTLIDLGYLSSSKCADYYAKTEYKTWKLDIDTGSLEHMHTSPRFELQTVQNSNVYLGIRVYTPNPFSNCRCPSRDSGASDTFICRGAGNTCECPCTSARKDFHFCDNSFNQASDRSPACSQEPPQTVYTSPVQGEADLAGGKPACYMHTCTAPATPGECEVVLGCRWCETPLASELACRDAADCDVMTTPAVATELNSSTVPRTSQASDPESSALPLIGALFIIAVAVVVVVVVVVLKCCKRNKSSYSTIILPDISWVAVKDSAYREIGAGGFWDKSSPTPIHEGDYVKMP